MPKPPSLGLPEVAQGLTAERVGDLVTVRWTTPDHTTDKLRVKGPMTAVVCREAGARGKAKGASACVRVGSEAVTPGGSEMVEVLAGELATGTVGPVGYRVEVENGKGHSAGRSEAALVLVGAAPGAVTGLRVESRREGALVRWEKGDGTVELRRVLVDAVPVAAKGGKAPVTEVELRAEGDGDPGGMLDRGVVQGASYRYLAQRVSEQTVGGKVLVLRGAESDAVVFAMRDVFPPKAVTGLVAVPGTGSIDLSWEAGSDSDLAGYRVYRREGNGKEVRLNTEAVVGPAYRDTSAVAGVTYGYRVTAVDGNGNESALGDEVRESLR